jgi:hypothetical protein
MGTLSSLIHNELPPAPTCPPGDDLMAPTKPGLVSGKRRHPRFLLNAPIIAVLSDTTPETRSRSRTLDVSEGGIGGLFQDSWDPGLRVNLEVTVPIRRTPLKLDAIVRHHTGVRYGFELADVMSQDRATLRELCRLLARGSVR